ncbi:MAG: sigma 54-interacting transcriptional regulator [Acidobacteria bacterium]|nr:sigma 54-interacting transcriptional regulator [Acidobacteriota bacterium]
MAELDCHPPSAPSVRSQAESAIATVNWRRGDLASAIRHAQSAVYLAQESREVELTAWAYLHLLRLLIESGPISNVLTALNDARRTVNRAGVPAATAYLHICVSVLEGQTGRLDEAQRHCSIAESLLQASSNAWLASLLLLNRGCISILRCEFSNAAQLLRSAKLVAGRIGYVQTEVNADSNIGHIQLLAGEFDRAKRTFSLLLNDKKTSLFTRVGVAVGLARVHLALGELEDCENTLRFVSQGIGQTDRVASFYQVRWAAITTAQLLIRQGQFAEAVRSLDAAAASYLQGSDVPLKGSIYLTAAHAGARSQEFNNASLCLVRADELHVTSIRELQAQYYYASALVLHGLATPLEQQLRDRALRLWAGQGIVSVRLEMDDNPSDSQPDTTPPPTPHGAGTAECVADSLAAFTDLAHRPRLLGEEMQFAIDALACSPDAKLVETRENAAAPNASDTTVVLPLGVDRKKHLTLVCTIPGDPAKAILLADVLRMGRHALALEQAREEERNRAALWPAPPIEEQAGALFLAEEMQALLATARRIAPTTVPVLITGETGTGKEVLARTIHGYSNRAAATFLPFNCSSVPKDMLDSQLFGHRKGSFTGATEHFPGVIRAATGGTLFLDEIGETTLEVQPKLLRFLESNEVHPIGDVQPVRADVRVIVATNADLDALVAQGRLREDLFYRLNIVHLHVPPLRERRVEIPPLAHHYLQKHAHEYAKGQLRLAEETMEYLVLYRWPGNVRQLANEMRRMAALAETNAVLMPEHLSADIAASRRTVPASERVLDPTELVVRIDQPLPAAVQHLERAMIQHAIRTTGGRMEETAALLGVSRKGLYLKRVRYGLEPPEGAQAIGAA